jgi:spore maturation protein B
MAIAMFRASGAMDIFVSLISPVTDLIGLPAEILPAALMRPLSGSGSLGIITELINTHGPDSFSANWHQRFMVVRKQRFMWLRFILAR